MAPQSQADLLTKLPASDADELTWAAHKQLAFTRLIERIKTLDLTYSDDPGRKLAELRALRRQHHVLIIADRIRRTCLAASRPPPSDLRRGAEEVMDKLHYFAESFEPRHQERTPLENNYRVCARVHWHRLIKQAGCRPAHHGGSSRAANPSIRNGTASKLRKLRNRKLETREGADILRRYIAEDLQHAISTCRQAVEGRQRFLTPDVRKLMRRLEQALILAVADL